MNAFVNACHQLTDGDTTVGGDTINNCIHIHYGFG